MAQLSEELKLRRPGIPWRQISAFRHRIAHGYLELSLGIVWQLWQNEIPRLRLQLAEVLAAEFPAGPQG